MGFKNFINSLKNFGDTISAASEKADEAADTFLGKLKNGLILLERDQAGSQKE